MTPGRPRTLEDLREIVWMAERYSPPKVRESGFFVMVDDDALPGRKNEFFELTATSRELGLLAFDSAAIAVVRQSSAAGKIMVYKGAWEDEHYHEPRRVLQETRVQMEVRRRAEEWAVERQRRAEEARRREAQEAALAERWRRAEAEYRRRDQEAQRQRRAEEAQRRREAEDGEQQIRDEAEENRRLARQRRREAIEAVCARCNVY
jgi:hypothetical protein